MAYRAFRTNKQKVAGMGSPDIFQECFLLRQTSLRANKPLANMKPVFDWILLNNLSRENVQGPAMGVAWGWELYKSPDVVNSCRIQLTWSLQFCFQLKLDQNQVICQQNANHCLATFAGTQIATHCSRAFLQNVAQGFLTHAESNKSSPLSPPALQGLTWENWLKHETSGEGLHFLQWAVGLCDFG